MTYKTIELEQNTVEIKKQSALKRLLSKTNKKKLCWDYTGNIGANGYGQFWMNNKNYSAHRASFLLLKGTIPYGKHVCHTCDNKKCINPDHLFLGTPKENNDNKIVKGRQYIQKRKLSIHQIKNIHKLNNLGIDQRTIAKKYNIHQKTVFRFIHEKYPVKECVGESNNKSLLTESEVKEIRKMYIPHVFGSHRISKEFGVNKSTIQRVLRGETWSHI